MLSRFSNVSESNAWRPRLTAWSIAWSSVKDAPIFGHGLGSYGLIVYGTDFRAYPHNGVLEVWFEAGILGLISFMAFILMSFFVAMKRKHFALACIIVFLMLNFLKSSSLDELRLLFLVCGLSASFLVAEKEYKN